ncbi:MAG: tetratricopeptide repeat protein [Chitinivibrionales bacterium]
METPNFSLFSRLSPVLVLFLLNPLYAENGFLHTECIDGSYRMIAEQRYKEASQFLSRKYKDKECEFDAEFGRLLLDQTRMMDYESYVIYGEKYLEKAQKFIGRIQNKYKGCSSDDSLKYMFYEGNVLGSIGVVFAKTGSWVRAASPSIKSVKLLKKVKEREPDAVLPNYGVGLFRYYMGNSISWFSSMRDKADRGIKMIDSVSEFGIYPFNLAAKHSLAWIMIEQDDYRKARSIVDDVLKILPENTIFLRIKARIHLWTQEYESAVESGKRLAKRSLARDPVNWSDLISGLQIQSVALYELERYTDTRNVINRALSFSIPKEYSEIEYVEKYLESIKEIQGKIEEG